MRLLVTTATGLLAACGMVDPVVYDSGIPAHTAHVSRSIRRTPYAYDVTTGTRPEITRRVNTPVPPRQRWNGGEEAANAQQRQEAYAEFQAHAAQKHIDQAEISLAKAREKKTEADARLKQLEEDSAKPHNYTPY